MHQRGKAADASALLALYLTGACDLFARRLKQMEEGARFAVRQMLTQKNDR